MRDCTASQKLAIDTVGTNLLVSAAAGSGKTTVLAERCCKLVVEGCRVHQLLVLTFAEEAAAEMKHRIEARLTAAAAMGDGPKGESLKKQAMLAPSAHISTIHAFCARLIRQNFHLAGVDPAFRVLDAEEAALLQEEILQELFEEQFESCDQMRQLVDLYGDGQDEQLRQRVRQAYETMRSFLDADEWKRMSLRRLEEAVSGKRLADGALGREYLTMVSETLANAETLAMKVVALLEPFGDDAGKYLEVAMKLLATVSGWRKQLAAGDFDAVVAAQAEDLELRLSKSKLPEAEKNIAKAMLDQARDLLKKGDVRQMLALPEKRLIADLAGTLEMVRYFLRLTDLFEERYCDRKAQGNALDFSDLEHTALALLRDGDGPSDLARKLHRSYAHVLVDEYQDINPVQEKILQLVSRQSVRGPGPGNFFCVGDVKQSIYRFRLADPGIFLSRYKAYRKGEGGQAIPLSENFRSRKPLLDAINCVFAQLMRKDHAEIDYDDDHAFKTILEHPQTPHGFTGSPIELHLVQKDLLPGEEEAEGDDKPAIEGIEELEDAEIEANHVAWLIQGMLHPEDGAPRQVWDKNAKAFRPLAAGDIVVLMRSIKHRTREYARVFAQYGIPLRSESRSGFFVAVEVQDVLSTLKLLDNQQQDIPMAAFLRSPMAGLDRPEDAMAKIRMAYRDEPFHAAVARYARERSDALAKDLARLLVKVDRWRKMAQQRPVEELIATLYRETYVLAWYAALPNGPQRVANLQHLLQCAGRFAQFQQQGLYRFLNFLGELEEKDSLAQPPAVTDANSVRLMSIHASKGLEFPVVIVPGLGRRLNTRDQNDSLLLHREQGVALRIADIATNTRYPSLATRLIERRISRSFLAEELRILYVAMTRAQEHLILVGNCSSKQRERWCNTALPSGRAIDRTSFFSGAKFLDWLAPVFYGGNEELLKVVEVDTLAGPGDRSATAEVAAEPVSEEAAQAAIARLTYQYPHLALTTRAAATSVTALSKHPLVVDIDGEEVREVQGGDEPEIAASATAAKAQGELAAERGTVTHLIMEHMDFALAPATITQQIAGMVARGLLTPSQADLVEVESIAWFWDTAIGKQMVLNAHDLLRELPFLDAVEDGQPEAMDRVLLRGRIDALVPSGDAWIVVDYKTDRDVPTPGSERYQAYQKQVSIYREALLRSGCAKVAGVQLVFLHGRQVLEF